MHGPKKYLLPLLLFFCSLFILTACIKEKPDAEDSLGNPVYLSDYEGRWVVIAYWATWCKSCMTEIPILNVLATTSPTKIAVLGVSFDNLSPKELQDLAAAWQVRFPLLRYLPPQKFGGQEISSLPIMFLISPKGELVKTLKGPQSISSIVKAARSATE